MRKQQTERKDRGIKTQEHRAQEHGTGTGEKRYYRLYDVAALKRY